MKVLRIVANGLPLFNEEIDISFYSQQRVQEGNKDLLYPLFSNVYLNCAEAFIGINASGKTSVLKLILLVLDILNNEPINHIETREILGDTKRAILNVYYHSCSKEVCRLEIEITSELAKNGEIRYKIADEKLWVKSETSILTKKSMFDFSNCQPVVIRNQNEDYLLDDVSIIISQNKKNNDKIEVVSLLSYTNTNELSLRDDVPLEIISFLDPTIEKLYFDRTEKQPLIHLKFKEKKEIILNDQKKLNQYLSSGTIKGIVTFTLAKDVLTSGGYLVVDEIENHFNKEIVTTLIRFFLDTRINKHGGTLIFSTHYPELLDEYDRNDSIYITRNKNGISVENLSSILKRNDIKKSDAYQSGYLNGTVPAYEAYLKLKKSIAESIK